MGSEFVITKPLVSEMRQEEEQIALSIDRSDLERKINSFWERAQFLFPNPELPIRLGSDTKVTVNTVTQEVTVNYSYIDMEDFAEYRRQDTFPLKG